MPRRSCHFLIKKTAEEMAGTLYEEVMKDNKRWEAWKHMCQRLDPPQVQKQFIRLMWPHLIEQARQVLARLLGQESTPEVLKNQITEALILDNSLRYGAQQTPMWRQ